MPYSFSTAGTVNVYAIGMYLTKSGAMTEFAAFKGKTAAQLDQDETFFDRLINCDLPKEFELCMARDITGKQV